MALSPLAFSRVTPVSFSTPAPASQPLGIPPDRTAALAFMLQNSAPPDYSSVRSPIEGFAKALTSGLQGWGASRLAAADEEKKRTKAGAYADLLLGPENLGTPDPRRKALVDALAGGLVDSSALGPAVAKKLGLDGPPAPIKLGEGDTLFDPTTRAPIYTAPAAPKAPTPYTDIGQVRADLAAGFLTPEEAQQEAERLRQGAGKAPAVQEFFDEQTGRSYKAAWNPATNQWERIGGVKSDVLSPDAEAQTVRIAEAGRTQINNNIGPTGVDYGDPPKDMSWARDAGGQIVLQPDPETGFMRPVALPIAGGPIEREAAEVSAKAAAADQGKTRAANIVLNAIDRAVPLIEARPAVTTGIIGSMTERLAGTPANAVNELLTTIKANIGFDKLQAMREASPTGGAIGQVSNFEQQLLQATFGSLNQSQPTEQLLYNLRLIRAIFDDIANTGKLTAIGRLVDSGQITPEEGQTRAQAVLTAERASPPQDDPLGLFR